MHENDIKGTSRVEAFSDGVFAIAITLLVLDIHVPEVPESGSLLQSLAADWVTYLAFLIGFFTILICWINHHFMFQYIEKSNGMQLLFNGFKLLVVSFTPFATAILSKYIGTNQQQMAVSIYAGSFFLMGLSMAGIWHYAYRNKLTVSASPDLLKAIAKLYLLAPVCSGIIFILSFVDIWLCLGITVIMFVFFLFPEKTAVRMDKNLS